MGVPLLTGSGYERHYWSTLSTQTMPILQARNYPRSRNAGTGRTISPAFQTIPAKIPDLNTLKFLKERVRYATTSATKAGLVSRIFTKNQEIEALTLAGNVSNINERYHPPRWDVEHGARWDIGD